MVARVITHDHGGQVYIDGKIDMENNPLKNTPKGRRDPLYWAGRTAIFWGDIHKA